MTVCERCKSELQESTNWPVFSAAGGVVGIVSSAVTGVPIWVALGLIGGIAVDIQRCSRCGAPADQTNPLYESMTMENDGGLGNVFVPHQLEERGQHNRQPLARQYNQHDPAAGASVQEHGPMSPISPESDSSGCNVPDGEVPDQSTRRRYAWDEAVGQFSPVPDAELDTYGSSEADDSDQTTPQPTESIYGPDQAGQSDQLLEDLLALESEIEIGSSGITEESLPEDPLLNF